MMPKDQLKIISPPDNRLINQLIDQAQEEVILSRQAIPNIGFCESLISAKKRGIKIKLLLLSPLYFRENTVSEIAKQHKTSEEIVLYIRETVPKKEKFVDLLNDNDIEISYINHQEIFLNHSKFMIIDSKLAYIGSAPNDATSRLDVGILSENPLYIRILQDLFEADFYNKPFKREQLHNIAIAPINMRYWIEKILRDAQHEIYMMFPIITDDPSIFSILNERIKSGVQLRALCSPDIFWEDSKQNDYNRAYLQRLIDMGVQLKEVPEPIVHCRSVITDPDHYSLANAFIGSGNLKTHSLDHNREVGIVLSEESITSALKELFYSLWRS